MTATARAAPAPGAAQPRTPTLLDDLLREPDRFTFDAAFAALLRTGTDALRFEAALGLGYAGADVLAVERDGDGFRAVPSAIGLTGPSGALPRRYTEHVVVERRARSAALSDFLGTLAGRPIEQFAQAGIKYRPHRLAERARLEGREDEVRAALLALAGFAIPVVADRLDTLVEAVLHHAGAFAGFPRSAERLAAILSDRLGEPVEVEQFAGRWLRLSPGETTRLAGGAGPGRFSRLGVDAALGEAAWDIQSAIRLRVGPMSLRRFRELLPGQPGFGELACLARAYLDGVVTVAVNPVLAADAVPPLPLGGNAPGRLGWDTWLPVAGRRERDGDEAVFDPGDAVPNGKTR